MLKSRDNNKVDEAEWLKLLTLPNCI